MPRCGRGASGFFLAMLSTYSGSLSPRARRRPRRLSLLTLIPPFQISKPMLFSTAYRHRHRRRLGIFALLRRQQYYTILLAFLSFPIITPKEDKAQAPPRAPSTGHRLGLLGTSISPMHVPDYLISPRAADIMLSSTIAVFMPICARHASTGHEARLH